MPAPVHRADAGDRRRVQPGRDDLRAAAQGRRAYRRSAHLHAQGRDAVRRPSQCRHRVRAGAGRREPLAARSPATGWSSRKRPALVPLDLTREQGPSSPRASRRRRRWRWGDEIPAKIVAEICGLEPDQIETRTHRPVIASCGNNFVFAEVTSRAALATAAARSDMLAEHVPMAACRRHTSLLPRQRAGC